jgi:hypothetical protein
MSAFASYKPKAKQGEPASQPATEPPPKKVNKHPELPAGIKKEGKRGRGKEKVEETPAMEEEEDLWSNASAAIEDLFCGTSFGGMSMSSGHKKHEKHEEHEEKLLEGEAYDYIREHCVVPKSKLKTFNGIVGVPRVVVFAQDFERTMGKGGAVRPVSGLLLFGPSGTGKSACAQAIAHYLNGMFYTFSGADLPNGQAGAARIDALFDVALAGAHPAIIFIDEVDTLLSVRATARVGHFAKTWDRFTDGLLVIGATNNPTNIAPKILTGRFERKILLDNPNPQARLALILKQLSQEDHEHLLSKEDLEHIVRQTAGRSAVNMERLVSTAVMRAGEVSASRADFELAMQEEPSDYDAKVATLNAKFYEQFGWKGRLLPPRFFEPWEDKIAVAQSESSESSEES